ncbi:hypothetical protein [Sphaerimonospora thailandensis]|uniref:hypothetical protein n=1 Tax=Sphaerimonospora thailandensis TaxID=795644 RepID=UPI00194F4D19|nr:hypothetical protein [Sphaerimonospora thailandensis]
MHPLGHDLGRVRVLMGAALAASLLSGCAGPQYTYVRDDDGATYFKVPAQWRKVDQEAIEKAVFGEEDQSALRRAVWIVAYDADPQPSINHLVTGASGADDRPFVLVKVQKLSEEQRNQASLNMLRNSLGFPVALSDDVRRRLDESGIYPYKDFKLLTDRVLPVEDGVRGVRSVFNLRHGIGPPQTYDETAYLSADGTRISSLVVRCSPACHRERAAEIDLIAKSFKVKRILIP